MLVISIKVCTLLFDWAHYHEPNRQCEGIILIDLLLEIRQKNYRVYEILRLKIALTDLHLHHGIKRIDV